MWHLLSSRVHPEGFQFCHHHQQQHDEAGDRTIVNYTDYSYWYFSNSNYTKYCWEMCLAAGWLTLETNPAMVSIVVFRVHPSGFPYSEAFVNGALAITCVCLNIEGSEISLTFLKHEMSLDVFGAYLQKQTPCITSWRVCRILLTVHSSWKKKATVTSVWKSSGLRWISISSPVIFCTRTKTFAMANHRSIPPFRKWQPTTKKSKKPRVLWGQKTLQTEMLTERVFWFGESRYSTWTRSVGYEWWEPGWGGCECCGKCDPELLNTGFPTSERILKWLHCVRERHHLLCLNQTEHGCFENARISPAFWLYFGKPTSLWRTRRQERKQAITISTNRNI